MNQRFLHVLCLACLCQSVFGGKSALIIIDVQTCFVSGGSLAVTNGDDVIPVINTIRQKFDHRFSKVILSKDWHCPQHISFATMHAGKKVFNQIKLTYLKNGSLCLTPGINQDTFPSAVNCDPNQPKVKLNQTLWPDHCVADVKSGSTSSNIVEKLHTEESDVVVKKGDNCYIDSYSVFFDNGGLKSTGLENILKQAEVDTVFVTGLALDYCVYYTSMDAKKLGFETYTVVDASRSVAPETSDTAKKAMADKGINLINSGEIASVFETLDMSGQEHNSGSPLALMLSMALAFCAWDLF